MYRLTISIIALITLVTANSGKVKIESTRRVECNRKTIAGDYISVHYRGTLQSNGKEFDNSYLRGLPLSFNVGQNQVISGWDDGLIDMCIGEERRLTIPPNLAYGDDGFGIDIPPNSTLIFETRLIHIAGVA